MTHPFPIFFRLSIRPPGESEEKAAKAPRMGRTAKPTTQPDQ